MITACRVWEQVEWNSLHLDDSSIYQPVERLARIQYFEVRSRDGAMIGLAVRNARLPPRRTC